MLFDPPLVLLPALSPIPTFSLPETFSIQLSASKPSAALPWPVSLLRSALAPSSVFSLILPAASAAAVVRVHARRSVEAPALVVEEGEVAARGVAAAAFVFREHLIADPNVFATGAACHHCFANPDVVFAGSVPPYFAAFFSPQAIPESLHARSGF